MPTNLLNNIDFGDSLPEVLATEQGLRSPRMLTIDLSYVQPNENGIKILRSGSLIAKLASGYGRVYPAAKAVGATTTGQNILSVPNSSIFKAGDVIKKTSTAGTTIGTVATVNDNNTLTLEANAAAAVAANDVLVATDGGAVDADTIRGIVISNIDLTNTSNDVACYTSASVYGARLPFWSAAIQAILPEITLV